MRRRSGRSLWAHKVKARDNDTCVICGGQGVVAHHIKSAAHNRALALNVDNGVTLCSACHILAHRGSFNSCCRGKLSIEKAAALLWERAQSETTKELIAEIVNADYSNTGKAMEYHAQARAWRRSGG